MVFYNYKAEVAYKQNREDVMRDDSKVIPLEIPEPTAEEMHAKMVEQQTKIAEEVHKAFVQQSLKEHQEEMDKKWEEEFSNIKFEEDESLGEPETAEELEGRAELDAIVDEIIKGNKVPSKLEDDVEGPIDLKPKRMNDRGSCRWRDHVDASRTNQEISK